MKFKRVEYNSKGIRINVWPTKTQKMKYLSTIVFSLLVFSAFAQKPLQTIRGQVVDKESKFPLIGVSIALTKEDGELVGVSTDVDGKFRIENVPVGRQSITISYIGYEPVFIRQCNCYICEGGDLEHRDG